MYIYDYIYVKKNVYSDCVRTAFGLISTDVRLRSDCSRTVPRLFKTAFWLRSTPFSDRPIVHTICTMYILSMLCIYCRYIGSVYIRGGADSGWIPDWFSLDSCWLPGEFGVDSKWFGLIRVGFGYIEISRIYNYIYIHIIKIARLVCKKNFQEIFRPKIFRKKFFFSKERAERARHFEVLHR